MFIKSVCAEEDGQKKEEISEGSISTERIRFWPISNPSKAKKQKIAAVIGAASSQVSVMVASMLQLFKVISQFHIIILN